MTDHDKSVDLIGIKPLAKSVEIITQGSIDGAGAFFSRICLPVAEEIGFLLRDKVRNWRNKNILSITQMAKLRYENSFKDESRKIHPRLLGEIIEHGSWIDDLDVQSMWAHLLVSSCNSEESNQDNLVHINYLKNISHTQAKFLKQISSMINVYQTNEGFLYSEYIEIPRNELFNIFNTVEIHEIDFQIDHLREIGILSFDSGFHPTSGRCNVTLSYIGLTFVAKCQGSYKSAKEHFKPIIKDIV